MNNFAPPSRWVPSATTGSHVEMLSAQSWRLTIPPGEAGRYRLAQLDDYKNLPRRRFPWQPPLSLALKCRASAHPIPGTWGFGLWNDPFSLALLKGAEASRLPVMPNAIWFFFASPPNYLSLRDDLPAQGCLAATFRSPTWPAALLALGTPALPLLAFPPLVRLLRRWGRRIVLQDAAALEMDPTGWHACSLEWNANEARFLVDGGPILHTTVAPRGPLGLVIWVDNQYMSASPDGQLRFGTLPGPQPAWIEIKDLQITALDNHSTSV